MSIGAGGMFTGGPSEPELEILGRQEQEARQRLEDARGQNLLDDGVYEPEHHELIRKLEAEWKEARDRLHKARER